MAQGLPARSNATSSTGSVDPSRQGPLSTRSDNLPPSPRSSPSASKLRKRPRLDDASEISPPSPQMSTLQRPLPNNASRIDAEIQFRRHFTASAWHHAFAAPAAHPLTAASTQTNPSPTRPSVGIANGEGFVPSSNIGSWGNLTGDLPHHLYPHFSRSYIPATTNTSTAMPPPPPPRLGLQPQPPSQQPQLTAQDSQPQPSQSRQQSGSDSCNPQPQPSQSYQQPHPSLDFPAPAGTRPGQVGRPENFKPWSPATPAWQEGRPEPAGWGSVAPPATEQGQWRPVQGSAANGGHDGQAELASPEDFRGGVAQPQLPRSFVNRYAGAPAAIDLSGRVPAGDFGHYHPQQQSVRGNFNPLHGAIPSMQSAARTSEPRDGPTQARHTEASSRPVGEMSQSDQLQVYLWRKQQEWERNNGRA